MILLQLLPLYFFNANAVSLNSVFDNFSIFNGDLLQNGGQNHFDTRFNVDWTFQETFKPNRIFDFIVVGSGPAGAVIANRLSENPDWNVLLLEAGKAPTVLTDIPMMLNFFQFTDYNWGYLMEKQDNMCLGLEEQKMHWPRGRVLGGSSVINFMIHIRGNRLDFDRWHQLGNEGWSFEEVLPYFKKSEDFLVKLQDPEYHQRGGYLGVQDVRYRTDSAHAFVKAMQEFGYEYVDYNGESQIGVSYVHATNKNGRRASAYNAFLVPVRHRRNLQVYTEARVTKILIDPNKRRAYGVQFVKNGRNYIARASKEVIVSAGALSSPQLLMLSGVGPRSHLEELGIPVVQDLPVGQKLYDHLTVPALIYTVNESITLDYDQLLTISSFTEFLKYGRGVLTSIGGVEALGIIKTPISDDPDASYPDLEYIFLGGGLHLDRGEVFRKTLRVPQKVYDVFWKPLEGRHAFTVLPMMYHPKSHGFLKLKSRNPYHWPLFYGNYFTDPENHDVRTFIAGIRQMQRIAEMPALQKYNAKMWNFPVPGCEGHSFDTDDYWECALRHLAVTLHHQVATCKMGPSADPEAVVSDELKMHGIGNLRVADTSIIPGPITAHTNVPSFMIGEKAADMIKQSWLRFQKM